MRLIDADKLKQNWLFRGDDGKAYRDVIDEQPTIEPQKWIPCSERLPEIGETYIVTGKQKWSNQKEWEYFTDVAIYEPVGAYIDDCWTTWNDWIEGQETHVIAWMEMPDPWKEEEE